MDFWSEKLNDTVIHCDSMWRLDELLLKLNALGYKRVDGGTPLSYYATDSKTPDVCYRLHDDVKSGSKTVYNGTLQFYRKNKFNNIVEFSEWVAEEWVAEICLGEMEPCSLQDLFSWEV